LTLVTGERFQNTFHTVKLAGKGSLFIQILLRRHRLSLCSGHGAPHKSWSVFNDDFFDLVERDRHAAYQFKLTCGKHDGDLVLPGCEKPRFVLTLTPLHRQFDGRLYGPAFREGFSLDQRGDFLDAVRAADWMKIRAEMRAQRLGDPLAASRGLMGWLMVVIFPLLSRMAQNGPSESEAYPWRFVCDLSFHAHGVLLAQLLFTLDKRLHLPANGCAGAAIVLWHLVKLCFEFSKLPVQFVDLRNDFFISHPDKEQTLARPLKIFPPADQPKPFRNYVFVGLFCEIPGDLLREVIELTVYIA
jgi:hypothetical protein